jgi:hypothetical protein
MVGVITEHPEYIKVAPRYKLIRSIIANDAKCFLRSPEPDDPSSKRNVQYKEDGILTNFTNLTCEGLTGLIFRKKLRLALPSQIDYLIQNCTGSGINIYQFSQHTASELLQVGRQGLLVDFYDEGGKAYIKPYCAEAIKNWKTKVVDGEVVYSLITLCEQVLVDSDDPFNQTTKTQYRVLRLSDDNIYYQEIYDVHQQKQTLIKTIDVKDYNGAFFNRIPFIFLGSQNNDENIDQQPLYDLAVLNLGHYRNSCDYEESIFICGQPYLTVDIGDTSQKEFDIANPNGIAYGSRKALILGTGGKATLLQASEKQLPAQAMREKLEEAARIGARLIEAAGGRETAEAARIRYGSQHSALYTLTSNMGWGITKALQIVCQFMGADPNSIKYILNKDFYEDTADPNLIAQQMIMLENGVITREEIRDYAIKTGVLKDNTDSENLK